MNLTKLGNVLNVWHLVYAIIFLTFFPYLTKGTTIHEHVVILSQYGTLSVLIAPLYVKLMRLILKWYAKTGRNLDSPTFLPMLLVGALIGTLISYVVLRIFKHEGNWDSTLEISYDDAIIAFLSNLFLALFAGLWTLISIYYRAGANIIMKHGKPTSFWKIVVALFSIPLLLMFATIVGYIVN